MSLFALQILLVGGAVQGLCLALLLATRRANPLANRLLAGLILVMSGQAVLVAFDTRTFFLTFPHLSKIGWLLPTLFGPLIYLFTRKLISRQPRLRGRDACHLLPFAAVFVYLLPYTQPAATKIAYLTNFDAASRDDFGWLNQVLNLLHVFYLVLALRALRQHERRLHHEFSDLTRVRLRWLRQFLLIILSTVGVGIVAFYGRKWQLAWLTEVYHFHYLGVVGLIYWIGYKALAQPALFTPTPSGVPALPPATQVLPHPATAQPLALASDVADPTPGPGVKYQKSALTETQAEDYVQELLRFMDTQAPYRQNNLTLQDLAYLVGHPKHRLSQLLNERVGKNFYDFVNEYRVAEVKRLLLDPRFRHYTTLAIAEEAGFNSKATFNAVFKKLTGLTPSEYVKQASQT